MRGRWRLRSQWGLRAKMTASYVLVTVAAVLAVEVVLIGVALPWLLDNEAGVGDPQKISSNLVAATAVDYAGRVSASMTRLGHLPGPTELRLGEPGVVARPGEARV